MEFHVLASGSKGNATFIHENNTGILIDCGISRKQLLYRLKEVGYDESDIHYVLLTHDHFDHNKNIHIFDASKLYTSSGNVKEIDEAHTLIPYTHKQLGDFDVFTLSTSHDASDPIAFVISGNESLLFMTDTGYISKKNQDYMINHDYYIIESNHDIEMLMSTNRPIFLKNRILNDMGHLDNTYSATVMSKVIGDKTKEIVLAHLSQEANTKELALKTYYEVFTSANIPFNNIKVASQVSCVSGGKYEG